MRKVLTWIVVTAGIAALARKLRSRGHGSSAESAVQDVDRDTPEPPPAADDPAAELRERLASSRESEAESEADAGADAEDATSSDLPTPEATSEPSIDEHRKDVHDQGRAAIDEMRKSAEDN